MEITWTSFSSSLSTEGKILKEPVENSQKADSILKINKNELNGNVLKEIDGFKILDGKVEGKIPLQEYEAIKKASVHNSNADSITLGRYNADGKSYITVAQNSNSSYFDLGASWGEIQKKYNLTDDEMFEYFNKPFLDDEVKSGKEIRFSHNPTDKKHRKTFLYDEWSYLQSKYGYKSVILEGDVWIAIK